MRRTPVYDQFDDHDDPNREPPPNVRRISTAPGGDRPVRRAEVRPLHASRRPPPRRGPDPRVWFIRGSVGIAALAGLWLGLQAMFPINESRVSQAPTPAQPQAIDASAVGAPEPPVSQQSAQPTLVAQPAPAPAAEGDRLPGLPTPDGSAAPAAPAQQAAAQPAAPAQQPASAPVAAQPAAEPKPRDDTPAQQPLGTPTLAPIPPPPGAPAAAAPAAPAQQTAPAPQAAAAKPQAPPPPPAAPSGGPFELAASASPVNPISEQANVTISVRATQNGAPLAGASCMASIYYRTATAKQPNGGFRTNANGVGSFVLDARGTTYGYYVPVDVTCTGRGGTVTARTGFTPVRGR